MFDRTAHGGDAAKICHESQLRDWWREPAVTIVIVTLDGVRWHEVFEGVDAVLAKERGLAPEAVVTAAELMPNLHAIIDTHGVALGAPGHGADHQRVGARTSVSLPGYAELLSGRRATAAATTSAQALARER